MYPLNIGYFLKLNADRYPDKAAVVYKEGKLTYSRLNERAVRLANSLSGLGVKKGDRVAYLFANCNELVEVFFAIQKIGAVAVPLNHRLVWSEIKFLLDSAECKVFMYSGKFTCLKEEERSAFDSIEILICSGGSTLSGEYSYEELVEEGSIFEPDVEIGQFDLCRIQFTGGTSGIPKGVMHTHSEDSIMTVGLMGQSEINYPDAVILIQSPMNHHGGYSWLLCAIAAGCTLIIQDTFNIPRILERIQTEKVSHMLLMPPSSYLRLTENPASFTYDLTSVKVVQTSAGGTSEKITRRIFDLFPNCAIHYGWGQTESGIGSSMKFYRDRSYSEETYGIDRAKTVGKPANFIEYKIVDNAGSVLPAGKVGELLVKGPTTMTGYYNQLELTAAVKVDGWVHTGDMFMKDSGGYYYIMGRKKDMIKSGGENIFAAEVEGIIRQHPAVAECAVIGVPDEEWMEAVGAIIRLQDGKTATEEDIIEYCKSCMASYKKPKYVKFTDKSLADAAGKIQKGKLGYFFDKEGSKR